MVEPPPFFQICNLLLNGKSIAMVVFIQMRSQSPLHSVRLKYNRNATLLQAIFKDLNTKSFKILRGKTTGDYIKTSLTCLKEVLLLAIHLIPLYQMLRSVTARFNRHIEGTVATSVYPNLLVKVNVFKQCLHCLWGVV